MTNADRLKQIWTITKIELRRAFMSKRLLWVYGLALFPSLIFLSHSVSVKLRREKLSVTPPVLPAALDGIQPEETIGAVLTRLGRPASDFQWQRYQRVREKAKSTSVTTHEVQPPFVARFVRLNVIIPSFNGDPAARIYEFEVYGDGPTNLALNRPAIGSPACSAYEGPEKAFNGSVAGGNSDRWCSRARNRFLQVDLGEPVLIKRIVIRHAGSGGEDEEFNTSLFNIQASSDNTLFTTIVNSNSSRLVDQITWHRRLTYFDGQREAILNFTNGKLSSRQIRPLLSFEEDRKIFAGVFQYFYLRLAIFFGCVGIFMNLIRGEMLDKTLHFWFLAPVRRAVRSPFAITPLYP